MSIEEKNLEEVTETISAEAVTEEQTTEAAPVEEAAPAESMDDYKDELEKSYKKVNAGDMLTGTVAGKSDTDVTVDLGLHCEGIIPAAELSYDPSFSITNDIQAGDQVTAVVLKEDDGNGNILLSKRQADNVLVWSELKELLDNETVLTVKISGVVNGGVIAYVKGIRGFIPASLVSVSYVEDLNEWLDKEVKAKVITVDEEKKRLVLSAKAVALEERAAAKQAKFDKVAVGDIFEGVVEKLTSYGAFIRFENDLSGLVHISQISQKHIKTPNEAIKEGETVKFKIIAIKDGKLSLSIKALQDPVESNYRPREREKAIEYKDQGEATTGLASLLSGIKLD